MFIHAYHFASSPCDVYANTLLAEISVDLLPSCRSRDSVLACRPGGSLLFDELWPLPASIDGPKSRHAGSGKKGGLVSPPGDAGSVRLPPSAHARATARVSHTTARARRCVSVEVVCSSSRAGPARTAASRSWRTSSWHSTSSERRKSALELRQQVVEIAERLLPTRMEALRQEFVELRELMNEGLIDEVARLNRELSHLREAMAELRRMIAAARNIPLDLPSPLRAA